MNVRKWSERDKMKKYRINKNDKIPEGTYTAHIEHFPNQAKNVFTFIIDEADDAELIGKGVSHRMNMMKE